MLTENQLLELTFDISSGCRHNCTGCHVIKEQARMPTSEEWKQLFTLVDDCQSKGIEIAEITLGPTDLLTATNREEIFNSPEVAKLCSKFKVINYNITCLLHDEEPYIWMAKQISKLGKGKFNYLFIPVEPAHIYNKFYMNTLRYRIGLLMDNLEQDVIIEQVVPVMNINKQVVFNKKTGEGMTRKLYDDFYDMNLWGPSYFDFGIHYGRNGMDKQSANDFIDTIQITNDVRLPVYEELRIRTASNPHEDFLTEINPNEGIKWNLYWTEGKMYKKVHVGELVAICDEAFRIPLTTWTKEDLEQCLLKMYTEQLTFGEQIDDCAHCPFVVNCALAGRFKMMEIAETERCYFFKKMLFDNGMEIY